MKDAIQVPNTARVACPKAKGRFTRVSNCVGCEHFTGMVDRFPGTQHLTFSQQYIVGCRYPTGRTIVEVED